MPSEWGGCRNERPGSITNRLRTALLPNSIRNPIASLEANVMSISKFSSPMTATVRMTGRSSACPLDDRTFLNPTMGCSTVVLAACDPCFGATPNRAVVWPPSVLICKLKAWMEDVTAPLSTLALIGVSVNSGRTTHSRQPISGLARFARLLGLFRDTRRVIVVGLCFAERFFVGFFLATAFLEDVFLTDFFAADFFTADFFADFNPADFSVAAFPDVAPFANRRPVDVRLEADLAAVDSAFSDAATFLRRPLGDPVVGTAPV